MRFKKIYNTAAPTDFLPKAKNQSVGAPMLRFAGDFR